MSDIKAAMRTVFAHEGLFTDSPADPGGATNFGISLRFLLNVKELGADGWPLADINHDGTVNKADIKSMNIGQAYELYNRFFWTKYKYFLVESQKIATKLMDIAVNMGPVPACKCLQRAVRASSGEMLTIDGILGPTTLRAINKIGYDYALYAAFKAEIANQYQRIVDNKPELEIYLKGWLNRCYSEPVL